MSKKTNKYGLSRSIPEEVKAQVRKNCGFGCVVCGKGIYQYDHVDPEFKNATSHKVENITLLCGRCHERKTRRYLSLKSVKIAMKAPFSLQRGYADESMDIDVSEPLIIRFGSFRFENCPIPFRFRNYEPIVIQPPLEGSARFRISASFQDEQGKCVLSINDNEWRADSTNWDVENVAGRTTIRNKREEVFILNHRERNVVHVELYRSRFDNIPIVIENGSLYVSGSRYREFQAINCNVGFLIP